MNNIGISDEQLVVSYLNGDTYAFDLLYKRYQKMLENQSRKDHRKHPLVDEEDFYSSHAMKFVKAVESFNLSSGKLFKYWLTVKLSKSTYDVVKQKLYHQKKKDANGKMKQREGLNTVSLDGLTEVNEDSEKASIQFEDKRTSIEAMQNVTETDLYKYIQSKSETDAKVAVLLTQNYSYSEIAKLFDFPNKFRVQTIVTRLRKYATEYKNLDKNEK